MPVRHPATILPALPLAAARDTTRIHCVAGLTSGHTAVVAPRPFRAPHHPIADMGVSGGGHRPLPGEVPLAHHGLRLLDELQSSSVMASRSGANRSRMVSYKNYVAHIADIVALAALAAWAVTPTSVHATR